MTRRRTGKRPDSTSSVPFATETRVWKWIEAVVARQAAGEARAWTEADALSAFRRSFGARCRRRRGAKPDPRVPSVAAVRTDRAERAPPTRIATRSPPVLPTCLPASDAPRAPRGRSGPGRATAATHVVGMVSANIEGDVLRATK